MSKAKEENNPPLNDRALLHEFAARMSAATAVEVPRCKKIIEFLVRHNFFDRPTINAHMAVHNYERVLRLNEGKVMKTTNELATKYDMTPANVHYHVKKYLEGKIY